MRHLRVPLFLIASLLFAATLAPSPAADAQSVVEAVDMVELDGGVLYAAVEIEENGEFQYVELRVYDVSDPMVPSQIGSLTMEDIWVSRLEVEGDLAYVAFGGGPLWILDVSDPFNPTVLDKSLVAGDGFTAGGRYVYIKEWGYDGELFLHIYRVDENGTPRLVSTYARPSSLEFEPSTVENIMDGLPLLDWPYVYMASKVDVSDPENPVRGPLGSAFGYPPVGVLYVKDGVGYAAQASPVAHPCNWKFAVSGQDKEWEESPRYFYLETRGSPPRSYEMAHGRYLLFSAPSGWIEDCPGYFQILDFSQFSFATGEGPISAIYTEEGDAGVYDLAYHEDEGVIYVARGSGGIEVMRAPFPTLNRHLYFPLVSR